MFSSGRPPRSPGAFQSHLQRMMTTKEASPAPKLRCAFLHALLVRLQAHSSSTEKRLQATVAPKLRNPAQWEGAYRLTQKHYLGEIVLQLVFVGYCLTGSLLMGSFCNWMHRRSPSKCCKSPVIAALSLWGSRQKSRSHLDGERSLTCQHLLSLNCQNGTLANHPLYTA